MGGYRVVIDASKALKALLDKKKLSTLEEIGKRGASYLRQASLQAFVRQSDPETGKGWKQSKRAERQHGQTLLDTGRLRRTVDATFEINGAQQLHILGGVRSPLVYARIHQFGGLISNAFGRGMQVTMPKRRYVGFTTEKFNAWVKAVKSLLGG